MHGWKGKSFSFLVLTSYYRNTDVCKNRIEVTDGTQIHAKQPDPGLNYTESKRDVWMGRTAQASGVACLVGVQRAVQSNSSVKSEPKYVACEESPVRAFYC